MPDPNNVNSSAILLTPAGSSAIAVVRLSGPLVPLWISTHFSKVAAIGRCVHGELRDDDRILDDIVVVLIDAKTADLNLHGGSWVVQSVLSLAARAGFVVQDRPALPLSDTAIEARSTIEREVLSHLPLARTELGVRALLAQPEAWAGFIAAGAIPDGLERVLSDSALDCLLYRRRVAIVGAANVGKSTLANQLFAQERSITADVPGTTRDWVGEIANVDGLPILLLDTPGLRATSDRIEAEAIERSGREIQAADATILVIDASRPLEGEQIQLLERFPQAIRVVNKMDKPCCWETDQLGAVPLVATTGQGVDELRRRIVRHLCGQELIEISRPRCWTDRQRAIVQRAMSEPRAIHEL